LFSELEVTFMPCGTIGVQIIMPKTGTSPKATPEQQASEREAATQPVVKAPPPPGMGKIVDKIA
jgi:hypothetical protein